MLPETFDSDGTEWDFWSSSISGIVNGANVVFQNKYDSEFLGSHKPRKEVSCHFERKIERRKERNKERKKQTNKQRNFGACVHGSDNGRLQSHASVPVRVYIYRLYHQRSLVQVDNVYADAGIVPLARVLQPQGGVTQDAFHEQIFTKRPDQVLLITVSS